MKITTATPADLEAAVGCLAEAFSSDPITGFLLQTGAGYRGRLTQFFSLLMRARIALKMPVLLARGDAGLQGAAMGTTTTSPAWPGEVAEDWHRFEQATPGLTERLARYDDIAAKGKPLAPHYYLGVIGIHPAWHGRGHGTQLLGSFCELSANDPLSCGVYLETATASNVGFYERAGFAVTGHGSLGSATLWCLYLQHRRDDAPVVGP